MKVNDLYKRVKDTIYEKASSGVYDDYLLGNVNTLISELYDENNMARMFKGMPPLTEVPYVNDREDELKYEDEYLNQVMPYGLANLFEIDDDMGKHSVFEVYYNNARVKNQKMVNKETIEKLEKEARDALSI